MMTSEGTLLSQVVTSLGFASMDRDPKPEVSEGPEVLGCDGEGALHVLGRENWHQVRWLWVLRSCMDGFRESLPLRGCSLSLSLCSLTVGSPSVICLGFFPRAAPPHLAPGWCQGRGMEQHRDP